MSAPINAFIYMISGVGTMTNVLNQYVLMQWEKEYRPFFL